MSNFAGQTSTIMQFIPSEIAGVWLIEPKRFGDARGYFAETYRADLFRQATGLDVNFIQDNESLSSRGVLRGLHMQSGRYAQAKLVRVSEGEVFDVAVDLRPQSPTFGKWVGAVLSSDNGRQLFIPRGMAHGFLVLSDRARFQYKVDNVYAPQSEVSLRYDDPDVAVAWPDAGPLNLSAKDISGRSLAEVVAILAKAE